jgi:predicted lysophospholipase L1 biosynthesis ABC-type transport system permease subunit
VWERDWWTIVGVVEDVKNYGLQGPPKWVEGEVYVPLAQGMVTPQKLALAVRVESGAEAVERQLPGLVAELCSQCAVSNVARMESVVATAASAPRSIAWLVGSLAGLALLMAAAGIYGVVNHSVVRRTKEIGVRIALGASAGNVAWVVGARSAGYTLLGTAIGLGAAWALTKWVKSLLYGIAEHDGMAFAAAPVLLGLAAITACVYPVARALRIDPAQSLREG